MSKSFVLSQRNMKQELNQVVEKYSTTVPTCVILDALNALAFQLEKIVESQIAKAEEEEANEETN